MPDTPLNPDALEAATRAVSLAEREMHTNESLGKQRHIARRAVSAYLAAALPEVSSVEELDQLPHGAIVLDADDDPMMLSPDGEGNADWVRFYDPGWYGSDHVALPARVLYSPGVNDGQA